jgi:hypothetical protein
MVNPIKNQAVRIPKQPTKKKPIKAIDRNINKVASQTKSYNPEKTGATIKASQKIAGEKAAASAQKAAYTARLAAFEVQKAAVQAQKAAFLAQRAHMAQQAAAARRARAAEKARKAAQRATKKPNTARRIKKIKAYLARPTEKKRTKLFKKHVNRKKEQE